MTKITFEEYFQGVNGLTPGEKRGAKAILRHAFNRGRAGVGLANCMVGNVQYGLLPHGSKDALSRHIVAACRAGECQ